MNDRQEVEGALFNNELTGFTHGDLVYDQDEAGQERGIYSSDSLGLLIGELFSKYPHFQNQLQEQAQRSYLRTLITQPKSVRLYYKEGDVLILSYRSKDDRYYLLALTPRYSGLITNRQNVLDSSFLNAATGELSPFSDEQIAPLVTDNGVVYLFPQPENEDYGEIRLKYIKVEDQGEEQLGSLITNAGKELSWHELAVYNELDPEEKLARKYQEMIEVLDRSLDAKEAFWNLAKWRLRRFDTYWGFRSIDPETEGLLCSRFGTSAVTDISVTAYGRKYKLTGLEFNTGNTAVVVEAVDEEGGKAAVKFGLARANFLKIQADKSRVVTPEFIEEELGIMERARRDEKSNLLFPELQEMSYLSCLGEGEIGNTTAAIPYIVMRACSRDKTIGADLLALDLLGIIQSEALNAEQRAKAFQVYCFLLGYDIDALRSVFGAIPHDKKSSNLILIPDEKRVVLLDLNVSLIGKNDEDRWRRVLVYNAIELMIASGVYNEKLLIQLSDNRLQEDLIYPDKHNEGERSEAHQALLREKERHDNERNTLAYVLDLFIIKMLGLSGQSFNNSPEGMKSLIKAYLSIADLSSASFS